jgi:hypothetical protein
MDIRSDGLPLPQNVVQLTNPESGIKVTFALVRMIYHREGQEKILWPDYMPMDMPHVIETSKIERLEVHATVHNPNKVHYQMWEDYILWFLNRGSISNRLGLASYMANVRLANPNRIFLIKSKNERR